MVRGERVKRLPLNVVGVAGVAFTTTETVFGSGHNPNGELKNIEVEVSGNTTYELRAGPIKYSGLDIERYLNVEATGTTVFHPSALAEDVSGTAITDGHREHVLIGGVYLDAISLATGSGMTMTINYI